MPISVLTVVLSFMAIRKGILLILLLQLYSFLYRLQSQLQVYSTLQRFGEILKSWTKIMSERMTINRDLLKFEPPTDNAFNFKKWFDRRNLQLARWHYYVYCEKFTNNDKCPITETFQPNSLMNMAAEKVRRHLFISAYMKCYEFRDFAYPFQIVPEKLWNECWKYKSMTYHELLADVMKILRKNLE